MQSSGGFLTRITNDEQKALTLPSTVAAVVVIIVVVFSCLSLRSPWQECVLELAIGAAGLLYIYLLYNFFLPLSQKQPLIHILIVFVNGVGTALLPAVAPAWEFSISIVLIMAVLIISALLAGRWLTYLFITINTGVTVLLSYTTVASGSPPPDLMWWVRLLILPVVAVMSTETIIRLGNIIGVQMKRLEIVNNIAQRISTTIEPNEVISLVNQALQDTLLADSYFVGIMQDGKLRLEVFFDDGEYFPPTTVPLDGSLAGWIVRNRRSLLLRNLPKEREQLGLKIQMVGKPRLSLSWMGTKMESGGKIIGVIAMASYKRNAFTNGDLKLLESIAYQAALVIDNAFHHAEVEAQSRQDSLTRVYNHGYFIYSMNEFVQYSRETNTPLSLIMLDIDFFKQYNDNYGHQVGDEVLIQLVKTIRVNIRSTDIIGRWGGEEFAILLYETNGLSASHVAERIRQSLRLVQIKTAQDWTVPAPTVSLGIAVCPDEADNVDNLVHLADQRLYIAKERGRNQVEPQLSYWEKIRVKKEESVKLD